MERCRSAIDLLHVTSSVEIAALLKQRQEGIKVSLRAKSWEVSIRLLQSLAASSTKRRQDVRCICRWRKRRMRAEKEMEQSLEDLEN